MLDLALRHGKGHILLKDIAERQGISVKVPVAAHQPSEGDEYRQLLARNILMCLCLDTAREGLFM
jgi:hypothetical protein